MIGQAGQREEQIRQTIEVDHEELRHLGFVREVDHAPLRAAAHGAGEVQRGRLGRPRGQHKRAEHGQLLVGRVNDALELGDPCL